MLPCGSCSVSTVSLPLSHVSRGVKRALDGPPACVRALRAPPTLTLMTAYVRLCVLEVFRGQCDALRVSSVRLSRARLLRVSSVRLSRARLLVRDWPCLC